MQRENAERVGGGRKVEMAVNGFAKTKKERRTPFSPISYVWLVVRVGVVRCEQHCLSNYIKSDALNTN